VGILALIEAEAWIVGDSDVCLSTMTFFLGSFFGALLLHSMEFLDSTFFFLLLVRFFVTTCLISHHVELSKQKIDPR
jgi:hypothetical protein